MAKKTQERGRVRRSEMVVAARKLLLTKDISEISLTDVAEAADIPKSSAYHLFSSPFEVYAAAAREIAGELKIHMDGIGHFSGTGWQSLVQQFIGHGAKFFNERQDAIQLILGPKTPPAIKADDRLNSDTAISLQLMRRLQRHFVLPHWPGGEQTFFHAIEIADLFFGLSIVRHQWINEEHEAEAVRATNAYLSLYLPPILQPAPQGHDLRHQVEFS